MITPISITVDGGTQEERNLVSHLIESSLTSQGFSVDNQITQISEDDEAILPTLFDYARESNPDLFAQVIEINQTADDVVEDATSDDDGFDDPDMSED